MRVTARCSQPFIAVTSCSQDFGIVICSSCALAARRAPLLDNCVCSARTDSFAKCRARIATCSPTEAASSLPPYLPRAGLISRRLQRQRDQKNLCKRRRNRSLVVQRNTEETITAL